jgi:hypothetical protein
MLHRRPRNVMGAGADHIKYRPHCDKGHPAPLDSRGAGQGRWSARGKTAIFRADFFVGAACGRSLSLPDMRNSSP